MEIMKEIPTFGAEDVGTGCCPIFHPEKWDGKYFDLSQYWFAKGETKSLFYIPLNLGKVMTKIHGLIQKTNNAYEDRYLILSQDVTPFRAHHYFLTKKEIPGIECVHLTGTFFAKVFDGSYAQVPNFIQEVKKIGVQNQKDYQHFYAFYTTCPNCAKTYQHCYIVMFAQ